MMAPAAANGATPGHMPAPRHTCPAAFPAPRPPPLRALTTPGTESARERDRGDPGIAGTGPRPLGLRGADRASVVTAGSER
jgi:hypothetical protein